MNGACDFGKAAKKAQNETIQNEFCLRGVDVGVALDSKQIVRFEDLLISQVVCQDALIRLLIEKGIFSEEEFLTMVRVVRREMKRLEELGSGGWCPKRRLAEDGIIPERYPLQETGSASYPVRTKMNVRDSDGTLILTRGTPTGGTAKTVKLAQQFKKPYLVVDLSQNADPETVKQWVMRQGVKILNVADSRESKCPGIHDEAARFLQAVLHE